jgi:hypothetical protein
VDDADGRFKAQLERQPADGQRVLGIEAAADHGIDVDVEFGVLGQHFQLFVEHLQALHRNRVRNQVVDGDLYMVKARAVQPLDPLHVEQVAVGNQAGNRTGLPDTADNGLYIRMGQRLAAGEADHGRSQPPELVDAAVHLLKRNRLRDLVVLVAVTAREVAEARGHNLHQNRVAGVDERMAHHRQLAHLARGRDPAPAQRLFPGFRHSFYCIEPPPGPAEQQSNRGEGLILPLREEVQRRGWISS